MSKKKLLIRADGNAVIGAGHIMRCLSIGVAAQEAAIECLFVTADDAYSDIISSSNIPHKILGTDYSDMNGEIAVFCKIIDSFEPTVVIVDSYSVTEEYLKAIRTHSLIAYLDDVKAFPYPIDVLINYNAASHTFSYPSFYKAANMPLPRLLLGESFTPLRKEFQNLKELRTREQVTDILFSAGGADPDRIALQFVNCIIQELKLTDYRFHLVLGKYEPDINEILNISKRYKNLIVHENVIKMADLMRSCDIAVSAAGSTLYELCACGVPTITYVLEDNQILGAASLSQKGTTINVGDVRTQSDFFTRLIQEILDLCSDFKRRNNMHLKAIGIIDGNGAMRLVKKLMSLQFGGTV